MTHYLDYNATAPLRPEVAALMTELSGLTLNASSVHGAGRRAKALIEDARRTVAEYIGVFPAEVIFTSSGTESNNWVLKTFAGPLFVSAVEHSSVLKARDATLLPVTQEGVVDTELLPMMLPQEGPFIVSLMMANNETGVIQPVGEAADIVHARGGLLHCDAVQGLGKIPVDFTELGCDFMTLCAHKMGGAVGAAALVAKNGLMLAPFLAGGGQEMNRRAGTENVAAIAGFAKAVSLIDLTQMRTLGEWMRGMEAELIMASNGAAAVFGADALRLPTTTCIAMPGAPSEMQLIRFDLDGIHTSAGSACSSGRVEPSHVLGAMGTEPELAGSALRISGGWGTAKADIDAITAAWKMLWATRSK